jgi:hypothetical protein
MMPGIYIMTNQSHSALYVGMGTVLPDRVRIHIDGEGVNSQPSIVARSSCIMKSGKVRMRPISEKGKLRAGLG